MLLTLPALSHGADVPLQKGLVVTTTTHSGIVSHLGSLPVADTEMLYSVAAVQPDVVAFSFSIGAPADQNAQKLLKKAVRFKRLVRQEDLASSNRINLSWGSDDPDMFPGQTFIQTSAAVLNAIKTKGETPFVMGINEGGLFSGVAAALPAGAGSNAPIDLGGFLSALGVERHYYRGTLKRIEPGTVPFPVLLNGVRTVLPAVHVRGTLKFGEQERTAEFYWLDDASNALTLKWMVDRNFALITRIDLPVPQIVQHRGGGVGSIEIGPGSPGAALAGKTCRAELHGLYFATGSAQLLPESEPMLKSLGELIVSNPAWAVTIEGHTDNIGSAEYNLALSNQRAAAVRDALTGRYHAPAATISAKGLGLTKPRESNTTDEGRARNRRVEIARACGS